MIRCVFTFANYDKNLLIEKPVQVRKMKSTVDSQMHGNNAKPVFTQTGK